MKKLFVLSFVFITTIVYGQTNGLSGLIGNFIEEKEQARIKEQEEEEARLARIQFVRDSIDRAEKQKVIAALEPKFTIDKDEFSPNIWYTHKNCPKSRYQDGMYCYFAKPDYRSGNFRFVFQSLWEEWLFIDKLIFNIDGVNYTITPPFEREIKHGELEWCDVVVRHQHNNWDRIPTNLIMKLAYAQKAKVKMEGKHYYRVRDIKSSELKTIRETYELYIALGGKF